MLPKSSKLAKKLKILDKAFIKRENLAKKVQNWTKSSKCCQKSSKLGRKLKMLDKAFIKRKNLAKKVQNSTKSQFFQICKLP